MVIVPRVQRGEEKAQRWETARHGSMAFDGRAGSLNPVLLRQGLPKREPGRGPVIPEGLQCVLCKAWIQLSGKGGGLLFSTAESDFRVLTWVASWSGL